MRRRLTGGSLSESFSYVITSPSPQPSLNQGDVTTSSSSGSSSSSSTVVNILSPSVDSTRSSYDADMKSSPSSATSSSAHNDIPKSSSSSSSISGSGSNVRVSVNNEINDVHLPLCEYVILSVVLWGLSLVLAIVFTNLGIVLALTGAVAASVIGFALPGMIYIRAHENEFYLAVFTTFGLILKSSVLYKNTNSGGSGSSGINNGMSSPFIYLPLPATTNEDEADEGDENESAIPSLNDDDNHSNEGNVVYNKLIQLQPSKQQLHANDLNQLPSTLENGHPMNNHITNETAAASASIQIHSLDHIIDRDNKTQIISKIRSSSFGQRFYAFYDFYLPVFMVLFGITALVTGVVTVLTDDNSRRRR